LSPEEIEDIEIVKGPSAATLYGTQAANGVVVITTKKGRSGASRWNWFAEAAALARSQRLSGDYCAVGHSPTIASTRVRCQLATMTPTTCIADSLTSINIPMDKNLSPIRNGHNTNYGLQISGGNEALRYFVSGQLFDEVGTYQMPEFAQRFLADSQHTPLRDEWVHPKRCSVRAFARI
jgi:TonB-dependent SusC/RagA subfamily outer membrane receptor